MGTTTSSNSRLEGLYCECDSYFLSIFQCDFAIGASLSSFSNIPGHLVKVVLSKAFVKHLTCSQAQYLSDHDELQLHMLLDSSLKFSLLDIQNLSLSKSKSTVDVHAFTV